MKHLLISAILFVVVGFSTLAFCELITYPVSGRSLVTDRNVTGYMKTDGENDELIARLCYDNGTCYSSYGSWSGLGVAIFNACNEDDSFEVEVDD